MPRKVFQAHLGFYDTVVAAPSQKSALAAWGAKTNLFQMGLAKLAEDPKAIASAMAKPGVILRRWAGTSDPYAESPDVPRALAKPKSAKTKPKVKPTAKPGAKRGKGK